MKIDNNYYKEIVKEEINDINEQIEELGDINELGQNDYWIYREIESQKEVLERILNQLDERENKEILKILTNAGFVEKEDGIVTITNKVELEHKGKKYLNVIYENEDGDICQDLIDLNLNIAIHTYDDELEELRISV